VNNLSARSLTAVFFVLVMVGSVLLGQLVFASLLLLITYLGLAEFFRLVSKNDSQPSWLITIVVGCLVYGFFAAHALGWISAKVLLAIVPLAFLLFIVELWRNKTNPITNIALSLTGIFYISVPFGLMVYLFNPAINSGPMHYGVVIGYLLILWLNDTGAYFTGSLLGKHKLFERVSPKKTWEGSIGGAIFALLTGWLMSLIFRQMDTVDWLMVSFIIIVTGTLGDLVESMFKRSLKIKDSGNILPGHGGILDRFDAVLISVPFVFVYLAIFFH